MVLVSIQKNVYNEHQNMSDEEIFTLSLEKPDMFEVIVSRYQEAFIRKARSIVHDEEAAKDIVQDTFVKIYLYGRKWKPVVGARWSSWVYRILLNTCLTKYNKLKRDRSMTTPYTDEMESVLRDEIAEERTESTYNTDYLYSLIDELPETFAKILKLYTVSGKSYDEIAEIEGVTTGAIKTRMHRARLALKKLNEKVT